MLTLGRRRRQRKMAKNGALLEEFRDPVMLRRWLKIKAVELRGMSRNYTNPAATVRVSMNERGLFSSGRLLVFDRTGRDPALLQTMPVSCVGVSGLISTPILIAANEDCGRRANASRYLFRPDDCARKRGGRS
jgi:hypothetical protein